MGRAMSPTSATRTERHNRADRQISYAIDRSANAFAIECSNLPHRIGDQGRAANAINLREPSADWRPQAKGHHEMSRYVSRGVAKGPHRAWQRAGYIHLALLEWRRDAIHTGRKNGGPYPVRIHSPSRHPRQQATGNSRVEPEQSVQPPQRGPFDRYGNDRSRLALPIHQFRIGPLDISSFLESTLRYPFQSVMLTRCWVQRTI